MEKRLLSIETRITPGLAPEIHRPGNGKYLVCQLRTQASKANSAKTARYAVVEKIANSVALKRPRRSEALCVC